MGIEPTRPAWKAGILPLNYTRISTLYYYITFFSVCQALSQIFFEKFTVWGNVGLWAAFGEPLRELALVYFPFNMRYLLLIGLCSALLHFRWRLANENAWGTPRRGFPQTLFLKGETLVSPLNPFALFCVYRVASLRVGGTACRSVASLQCLRRLRTFF